MSRPRSANPKPFLRKRNSTWQVQWQPVLAILALHAVLVGANASFTLRPNADRVLGPILFGCMLGLAFGAAILPLVLRWNRRAKALALFPYGILLRAADPSLPQLSAGIPVGIQCLAAGQRLPVYRQLRPVRHVSAGLSFVLQPPACGAREGGCGWALPSPSS